MYWYVKCYEDESKWNACVVWSPNIYEAEHRALDEYQAARWAQGEAFQTDLHGVIYEYTILK